MLRYLPLAWSIRLQHPSTKLIQLSITKHSYYSLKRYKNTFGYVEIALAEADKEHRLDNLEPNVPIVSQRETCFSKVMSTETTSQLTLNLSHLTLKYSGIVPMNTT
jgi:hypothetical protein